MLTADGIDLTVADGDPTHKLIRQVLAAFAELARTTDAGPVAELGCGPGRVTAHLRDLGLDVFGVDLSPANDSRFADAVGESGHFLSPHYADFLPDWRAVRHKKMRMERAEIDAGAIGRLRLVPQK